MKKVLSVAAALVAIACSSGGYPGPSTTPTVSPNAPVGWPVQTAEYVDLWLHGYAMVLNDTARVPLFDRGYRDQITDRRRQLNVTTALDANLQKLRDGMMGNPNIESGQFAVFNFESWDELSRVARLFVQN